jgi:hypothetical protein
VFGVLIIFFVIGISLAVQPDSSLANHPPSKATGRVTVRAFRPNIRHAYQRLTPVEIPSLRADQDR